jgi:hypothetical protein
MGQDYSIVAEQVSTTGPGGLTVGSAGSISLQSGATLTMASGSIGISGNFLADAGGSVKVNGNIYGGGANSATISVATANNTSIPVNTRIIRVSASAVTTSGSCTLAAPVVDGVEVTLINESANNIIISGNMKAGAAQTVLANAAARFTWITADTAWFHNT